VTNWWESRQWGAREGITLAWQVGCWGRREASGHWGEIWMCWYCLGQPEQIAVQLKPVTAPEEGASGLVLLSHDLAGLAMYVCRDVSEYGSGFGISNPGNR